MRQAAKSLLLTVLVLCLAGCSLPFSVSERELNAGSAQLGALEGENYTLQETEPTLLVSPQKVCLWARQQLTPQAQQTYDRLSAAIACHNTAPIQVDSSAEEVQLVLTALRIDHPEFFWFSGEASYVTSSLPLAGDSTTCSLSYIMDADEIPQRQSQIQQYVTECMNSPALQEASTDYEKILGVYRYIIAHTDYVLSSTDQSMLGVMTDHQGTCAGYSRTFQYLMHLMNIPCTMALGSGDAGENHGWNIVQCEGEWYHIDVTWGDPVGEDGLPGATLGYTYCMVTDDEILRDHALGGNIPMPVCNNRTWNYYRQSGRQMSVWDNLAYESSLQTAAEQGETFFSVRFDQQEAYDQAVYALIDQSEILTILKNCGLTVPEGGVTYSHNDTFLEFTVQLPA